MKNFIYLTALLLLLISCKDDEPEPSSSSGTNAFYEDFSLTFRSTGEGHKQAYKMRNNLSNSDMVNVYWKLDSSKNNYIALPTQITSDTVQDVTLMVGVNMEKDSLEIGMFNTNFDNPWKKDTKLHFRVFVVRGASKANARKKANGINYDNYQEVAEYYGLEE